MNENDQTTDPGWMPLGQELLAQATALLGEVDTTLRSMAEATQDQAAADLAEASVIARRVPRDSPEHQAISAAREAAKAGAARAKESLGVHRQVGRGMLDDLMRLGGQR